MSPSRYQVEADSIDELNARILEQYGPDAAVVATTVVTTGGLQGFFAQRKFQATVELSDGTSLDAHSFDLPARAGIAALLEEADNRDRADRRTIDRLDESDWKVSTSTVDFAAILADLTLNTAPDTPALGAAGARPGSTEPSGPLPLRGAGDLVVIVGLGDDALAVAQTIAAGASAAVTRIAGDIERPGITRIDDRRGAIAARAEGVRGGHAVVVAFGLPRRGPTQASASELENLHADQFWVAVDAGRKPEDSARWVHAVAQLVPLTAVMSWAPDETATPHSVTQLGLPVGWLEAGW
ncbi:hypothetical protein HD599_003501 [Conyzicola lurida]|uniref:Uncharacterized protein n=1 Tax=Conyzicola lurida TaxID=1172621 RepID=A0A841ASA0_9MICO|nr:hypothetical protein [Conyzicola lurida]MBB5845178.1 hypothetical protein [Conyzicola lurida]